MLDQLFSPRNQGTNLGGFKMDKIQVITFLASRKEIVVHLSQYPGDLICLHEMVVEEAAHPSMLGGRKAVLEQQGGYRVKAGIVKAIHTGGPTAGVGEHAGIFQCLVCPLQAVSHDIVLRLHYNVTPSRSTFCRNGMAR
jgi:hypothetical protein